MKGDLISVNGKLCRPGDVGISPDSLLSVNFVYQRMHAIGHRILHASTHAGLACTAYATLYGTTCRLSADTLRHEAATLLEANRYHQGSVAVMLYLFPGDDDRPLRIISCERQLLYKGYALWHNAEKAVILPYECPFAHFSTAVSLAAGTFASQYARRKGAGVAIAENTAGILYGSGGGPLFAVIGNDVITTPVGQGACDCVERRLVASVCETAGKRLVEAGLTRGVLAEYQELFVATTSGITCIHECGGNIYPNSTANRIASLLRKFTMQDL